MASSPRHEAATAAGAIHVVSTVASHTIEEVAEAAPGGRRWFQLYVQRDRGGQPRSLVERAAAAGYEALCLTVDLPVLGYRDEVLPARRSTPAPTPTRTCRSGTRGGRPPTLDEMLDMRSVGAHLGRPRRDPVVGAAPARAQGHPHRGGRAARRSSTAPTRSGSSNHGGRQLDRSPRGIDVLEEVVDAVEGRAEVYLDGGIRRGPEVLIALALGARGGVHGPAVPVGARQRRRGRRRARAFAILREELERGLALMGTLTPARLTRAHVEHARRA